MDAQNLARWTRFALKGGIGRCVAVQDCVAESAEDLMFLKVSFYSWLFVFPRRIADHVLLQSDEIVVLVQLSDEGRFLVSKGSDGSPRSAQAVSSHDTGLLGQFSQCCRQFLRSTSAWERAHLSGRDLSPFRCASSSTVCWRVDFPNNPSWLAVPRLLL